METAITLYNQSVQIETRDQRLKTIIEKFLESFYTNKQEGFGFNAKPKIDIYVGYVEKYHAYIMPKKQFKHFNYYLQQYGYSLKDATFINKRDYETEKIKYKVRSKWVFRDEQLEASEFISKDPTGTKLLPLATGSGKTVIGLKTLGDLGERFVILIMPTFRDKWIADIKDIHDATDDEICIIQGGSEKGTYSVEDVIKLQQSGQELPWKYYIISIPTYRNYVSRFEEQPDVVDEEIGANPLEFFPLLKVHSLLIDETHIAFYSLYKILCYSNVKMILGLSATLIPNNDLEERVYNCIYYGDEIFHNNMIKKYIKVFPLTYNIERETLKKLRWTNSFRNKNTGAYNHNAYEKSIMKNPKILESYCRLIEEPYRYYYEGNYITGDKCIIFVSSIKFATHLTNWLQKKFPNRKVVRYVEDDLYEDMIEGDVIVSTIGSAGTGLDIPLLRVGIQTVSVGSPKSNIQSMGRLRFLKDRDVMFIYMFGDRIEKQKNHHRQRIELFKDRVATINMVRANHTVSMYE